MARRRKNLIDSGSRLISITAICVLLSSASGCGREDAAPQEDDHVQLLQTALASDDWPLIIQAADHLTSLDYRSDVAEPLSGVLGDQVGNRIDKWRVLARLKQHDKKLHQQYLDRLVATAQDAESFEQGKAITALAQLGVQPRDIEGLENAARVAMDQGSDLTRAHAAWLLANQNDDQAEQVLGQMLADQDPSVRAMAGSVLRQLTQMTPAIQQQLTTAFGKEPTDSMARVPFLTAIFQHLPKDDDARAGVESELLTVLQTGSPEARTEVVELAAEMGDDWRPHLQALLNEQEAGNDLRTSAAYALCRIGRRQTVRLPLLDWCVVALYGLGMLAVGVYYARRTKTTGDYLLGGRSMRSWMVGLSLFATMLSTLSYLAWPGEMIKNGPIVLLGYCSFPLIYLVVGWFLIPRIMRLKVTSAYEILELRFGIVVRLLGSFLFLTLRFLWMASIIYWTTAIVLIPVSGLSQGYTPWFAFGIGLLTVCYTSLGGLKAVVFTDVIQTFILFLGAGVSLVLISNAVGGAFAWFPQEWAAHWQTPKIWFSFDPNTRATLANAMLGTFAWYVCTAGADQMAIQRYLSTKDVAAARRTLGISLVTDCLVTALLGMLGLALLAYFTEFPQRLADGQSVYANADGLFSRFVVVGLPIGFSGLVIAGLLAAAMSSLSSGVNSSAAVISEDFIRCLVRQDHLEPLPVRFVRWTSAFVGLLVVLLSSQIGNIQGNMLEVIYKVANLFTAPLFYLFFMAMFVKRANTLGTLVGSFSGIATAILIAFWQELFGEQGISFLWIIPSSFTVSVVVGLIASVLCGRPSPSIEIAEADA